MSRHSSVASPQRYRTGIALSGALLLAACASTTVRAPRAEPPAPELLLLDTGPLELPRDCAPQRGVVYRTSFVVQRDGSVTDAASGSGDGCVQRSLQQWASTFEYRPVSEPTAAVVDWMGVTASRGR